MDRRDRGGKQEKGGSEESERARRKGKGRESGKGGSVKGREREGARRENYALRQEVEELRGNHSLVARGGAAAMALTRSSSSPRSQSPAEP